MYLSNSDDVHLDHFTRRLVMAACTLQIQMMYFDTSIYRYNVITKHDSILLHIIRLVLAE